MRRGTARGLYLFVSLTSRTARTLRRARYALWVDSKLELHATPSSLRKKFLGARKVCRETCSEACSEVLGGWMGVGRGREWAWGLL